VNREPSRGHLLPAEREATHRCRFAIVIVSRTVLEQLGFVGNSAYPLRSAHEQLTYRVPLMLHLYARENAGRPSRVRWALEEAGAEYEQTVMTIEEGGSEEHRRRHPWGRVPVLETDEGNLWESAALCLQIADLHPDAHLIPAVGTYDRGLVYQWTIFAMSELEATLMRLRRARADEQDEAEIREALDARCGAVAAALENADYLVADRFTVADIVIGGVLVVARRLDVLPEGVLREYLDRLQERPARQRAYA
jgi:glutathione S-transferase